jgi:hypothetical protein
MSFPVQLLCDNKNRTDLHIPFKRMHDSSSLHPKTYIVSEKVPLLLRSYSVFHSRRNITSPGFLIHTRESTTSGFLLNTRGITTFHGSLIHSRRNITSPGFLIHTRGSTTSGFLLSTRGTTTFHGFLIHSRINITSPGFLVRTRGSTTSPRLLFHITGNINLYGFYFILEEIPPLLDLIPYCRKFPISEVLIPY